MGLLGQAIRAVGVISILVPIVSGVSGLFDGPSLEVATAYAPTFVIGGLLLYVVGTVVHLYTRW